MGIERSKASFSSMNNGSGKVTFGLSGLDEVLKKLASLSYDLQKKGGRAALRRAAEVIQKAADANAEKINDPRTPNSIYRNVALRWSSKRFKATGDLGFRVGILGGARGFAAASGEIKGQGKGNPGGDTYYWRFQEFGTSKHRANPFMRKSLEDNADEATKVFIAEYKKAIDKVTK